MVKHVRDAASTFINKLMKVADDFGARDDAEARKIDSMAKMNHMKTNCRMSNAADADIFEC